MNKKVKISFFLVFLIGFIISYKLMENTEKQIAENSPFSQKVDKNDKFLKYSDEVSKKSEGEEEGKKFDEPDKFVEVFRMLRTAEDESEPSYKPGYRIKELTNVKSRSAGLAKTGNSTMAVLDWVERGPANVGGRTRGIVVDPDDPDRNTWYCGSVGGGVWKTTDAGESWLHLTKGIPNLSTSTIALALSNPDVMYVGTGEGFNNADAIMGEGIFKTTDRGVTWTQLESTITTGDFNFVNRMAIDPSNEDILVVATGNGIYRTVDGGATFENVYSSGGSVLDLRANPENFNSLYAAAGGGVMVSRDAGLTWHSPSGTNSGSGRTEICVSPVDTSRIYASVDGSQSNLYVSLDAGENWIESSEEVWDDWNNDGLEGDEYLWLGVQGWYDNTIAAHPYDPNIVFFGGIDLWKSEISIDSARGVTGVYNNGFDSVFGSVPSGLSYEGGAVGTGNQYWSEEILSMEELTSVELRIGPGLSQKAHRFTSESEYQDYIEVPFQVWDVDNDKQLMVSFNDRRNNNKWDLTAFRGDGIYINAVDYDAANPSADIAVESGLKYNNAFVLQLRNADGVSFDRETFPEANLRIEIGMNKIIQRETEPIVDGYNQYVGSQPDIHVDHHNIVAVPLNASSETFRLLNGNDGGVAVSDDGGVSWRETDQNGYNTTQFYGIDKKTGASEYFGGTQDNGTWQSQPGESATAESKYIYRLSGDGFETAWNAADPDKMIGGSQYNSLYRTTTGGSTWARANIGFPDNGSSANSPFISKIASSKIDPDLVFTISRLGVYRSDDFAASWTLTEIPSADFHSDGYFSFANIAISLADPRVVWGAVYMSSSGVPVVSKDGGLSFSKASLYSTVSLGLVSGFDTHPTEPQTAYATFSMSGRPKILKTTDFGQSWEDITGFEATGESTNGFPDVACYCVAVMPFNTDIIWAGTEIGLIESVDGGKSWHFADNGLPSVSIWEMKIIDDEVVLATHGRGVWTVSLPELAGYTPPDLPLVPRINGEVTQVATGIALDVSLRSAYDSTEVLVNGTSITTLMNDAPLDTYLILPVTESGLQKIQLKSFVGNEIYLSGPKEVETVAFLAAKAGYYTTFSSGTDDWISDGFTFESVSGFPEPAAHSPHPYPDETELTLLLRTPIIVADNSAILKYEDVAIIETGTAGTVYGDDEFWDYVIVEADAGKGWIELLDGYDARANSTWLSTYNADGNGNANIFVEHSINLLDFFSPGDEVIIRFRLYADQYTNGWGWAINYVEIQPQFVGVKDVALPIAYILKQNYPNPFNPSTSISFSIPEKSTVKLNVFNTIGQKVATLVNEVRDAGRYSVDWNAGSLASGVYVYRIETKNFVDTKKMMLLK